MRDTAIIRDLWYLAPQKLQSKTPRIVHKVGVNLYRQTFCIPPRAKKFKKAHRRQMCAQWNEQVKVVNVALKPLD